MRTAFCIAGCLAGVLSAHAQDSLNVAAADTGASVWTFEPALLAFLYRDTIALLNPTVTADVNNLHLEARYQWEDWRTGSLWAGRWFSFGNALEVNVAPMIGGVFGLTNGVAPGYTIDASWRRLAFYSSSEYLIDLEDQASNFIYTWTELTFDVDHLLVGAVVQRTRTFESDLDVQTGLILLREQGDLTFGMYLFNAYLPDPTVTLSVAYEFEVAGKRRPSTP